MDQYHNTEYSSTMSANITSDRRNTMTPLGDTLSELLELIDKIAEEAYDRGYADGYRKCL